MGGELMETVTVYWVDSSQPEGHEVVEVTATVHPQLLKAIVGVERKSRSLFPRHRTTFPRESVGQGGVCTNRADAVQYFLTRKRREHAAATRALVQALELSQREAARLEEKMDG
jgi:hypothetical protein